MRVAVVVALRLRIIHWRQPLVAEIEGTQSLVFPLDRLVKVHH